MGERKSSGYVSVRGLIYFLSFVKCDGERGSLGDGKADARLARKSLLVGETVLLRIFLW